MSSDKKEFYGKDVAEAIKTACDALAVPQERLEIEVVETGSSGIFGLIRKKARIRVVVRPETKLEDENLFEMNARPVENEEPDNVEDIEEEPVPVQTLQFDSDEGEFGQDEEEDEEGDNDASLQGGGGELSEESIAIVKAEIEQFVALMGMSSQLDVTTAGMSITCTLRGENEEQLVGPEGKVLDSLQYLVRKMVSRKLTERIRLTINVGDFREKRLDELKQKALQLAEQVKADGKTQALPALNPSERRAIHMILQDDKEIRSRSVGDGLFKKVLIYKPGKGGRTGGRKRPSHRSKQN
jgi:spoIIIJ-associated protein